MFECSKHGEVKRTSGGYCPECCVEDHRCDECGVWSHERDACNVEWRDSIDRMLCDICVPCEDCGETNIDDVDVNSDFDAILCEDCTNEREAEWQRDEEERKERSLDYASKRENETDSLTQHEDGWR